MRRWVAGLALALSMGPAMASEIAAMRFDCRSAAGEKRTTPALSGQWDVVMDVGGTPSFGLLSIGPSDGTLAGSLALTQGVVVVRNLTLDGGTVAMVVASREGDVRFDGVLAADGRRMCGTVSYHQGRRFEMVAQKRPERAAAAAGGSGR